MEGCKLNALRAHIARVYVSSKRTLSIFNEGNIMLTLNNVSSGYSTNVINNNFVAIANYINQSLLNRDGLAQGEPNQMENALDMNSYDILNVGSMGAKEIVLDSIPIKGLLDNAVEEAAQEADRAKREADRAKQEADRAEGIETIVAGNGINVDDSDPANPIISATGSAGTEVNAQTGTAYTLVLTDAFKMVTMDNALANTLTVPPNSAVAFPANTRIDLGQDGAGQTTIVAGAGVTIRTPETLKLRKQWSKASLIRRAADVWDVVGDLEAEA